MADSYCRKGLSVMKSLLVAASLVVVLGAGPALAQGGGGAAQTPPAQTEPSPAPQAPAPFPQGAKVAFVNLQAIAQLSAEGKAAATKVQALTTTRTNEIAERTKAAQAQQQKLQSGAGVMSDSARMALEKEVERMARDLERFQQDAQADVNELQQQLQQEFQQKLLPVLEELSVEKDLHFLFSGADAGLIWAAAGLDLTLEAVRRLDAATAKKP
jgi:Skp family chaperone for outer membrane proteins